MRDKRAHPTSVYGAPEYESRTLRDARPCPEGECQPTSHHTKSQPEAAVLNTTWRSRNVVLVCGGLILLIAIGTRQSFGLFLQPMSTDLGWGRETFSFAIALQNLVWGLAMPLAGAIADRFGAARVMYAGGIAYALGLWAMAHSQGALAFDLSAGLLVGLGLACTGFGVVLAVVARAFPPSKRSAAVGIAGRGVRR